MEYENKPPLNIFKAKIRNNYGLVKLTENSLQFEFTDEKGQDQLREFSYFKFSYPFSVSLNEKKVTLKLKKASVLNIFIVDDDDNTFICFIDKLKEYLSQENESNVQQQQQENLSVNRFSTGKLRISVVNPKVSDVDEHVSYTVVTETITDGNESRTETIHRFSDFEILYNRLKERYPSEKLPELPPKRNFTLIKGDTFNLKRCAELDKFMKLLIQNKKLAKSEEFFDFIARDENSYGKKEGSYMTEFGKSILNNYILPFVDKKSSNENKTLQDDYLEIRNLLSYYEIIPKKMPFNKYVVLLLGTTSTGKSAYVNHLFGINCKKSDECQQDTGFSFIETVTPEVFASFSPYSKEEIERFEITREELNRPVGDIDSDDRNGKVFVRLKGKQASSFYEQLRAYDKEGLFEVLLINQKFLDSNHVNYHIANRVIVVDSPGFDSINIMDVPDEFMGNLKILQYLYNMCDTLLYFISCGQISTVSNQIFFLELAIIYALSNETQIENVIKKFIVDSQNKESKQKQDSSKITIDIPSLANVLKSMTGIPTSIPSGITDYIESSFKPKEKSLNEEIGFKGTSVWHKTLFVLTKADTILINKNDDAIARSLQGQYYELGVLLGKSLRILTPPVRDNCLIIALPEHQKGENIHTVDLFTLNKILKKRDEQVPYKKRLEASIQSMCDDLQSHLNAKWGGRLVYMNTFKQLNEIRKRSQVRMNAM